MNFLRNILLEAIQADGKLSDNKLAVSLYNLLRNRKFAVEGLTAMDLLTLGYATIDSIDDSPEQTDQNDRRVTDILLSGIKKFPVIYWGEKIVYYRINCCDKNNQPISTIVLGNNGTGKSSFYGILEQIFLGWMPTAKLHGISPEIYLRNLETSESNISGQVRTKTKDFSLDLNCKNPLCQHAFFISQWDMEKIEPIAEFGEYIFDQLGLLPFYQLIKRLSETIKKASETRQSLALEEMKRPKVQKNLLFSLLYTNILGKGELTYQSELKYFENSTFPKIPKIIKDGILLSDSFTRITKYHSKLKKIAEHTNKYLNNHEIAKHYEILLNYVEQLANLIKENEKNNDSASSDDIDKLIEQVHTESLRMQDFGKEIAAQFRKLESDKVTFARIIDELIEYQEQINRFDNKLRDNHLLALFQSDFDESRIDDLNSILNFLESEFNELVDRLLTKYIRPIFVNILSPFLEDDNAKIEIKYNSDTQSLMFDLLVKNDRNIETQTRPRNFFNTFRFEMFCIALKIACACCSIILHRQNWPIVIDDVFNSSDFDNRVQMGDVITSLLNSYNNIPESKDFPLQIILFTQDDIIGPAVNKSMVANNHPVTLLRLHDYRCFNHERDIVVDPKSGMRHITITDPIG